jgi:hypothetical protein
MFSIRTLSKPIMQQNNQFTQGYLPLKPFVIEMPKNLNTFVSDRIMSWNYKSKG